MYLITIPKILENSQKYLDLLNIILTVVKNALLKHIEMEILINTHISDIFQKQIAKMQIIYD